MSGFIKGTCRSQSTLFPEQLDDFVTDDNPVRVIDAFVDSLNLSNLSFKTKPAATGRPGYHPATMLKLYIYGYLNRIQSTRRLETESNRNIELMWLLERLNPDFKTIADFRKDNGKAIQKVCREFVIICRKLNLLSDFVAIDGSKFKAVNNGTKNFTKNRIDAKLKNLDKDIQHYLLDLQNSERHEHDSLSRAKKENLKNTIEKLKHEVKYFQSMAEKLEDHSENQISLTDPDSRSMKSTRQGFVGYNVHTAVDTASHIIVAHEVTNSGSDRKALASTAKLAKKELQVESLKAVADRGYFNGTDILDCENANIETYIPKVMTSNNRSKGLFDKADFIWDGASNKYICPAGERLIYRTTMQDRDKTVLRYWSSNCGNCSLKANCTTGKERRVSRWEHEDVLDKAEKRLHENPSMMGIRKSTVEHPFGTIKDWMGHTHFKMKRMKNVSTEMSLHVLAYNIKRVMTLIGPRQLIEALAG
jgi:transposase